MIDLTPYVDALLGKFTCDEHLHPELKSVCLEVSRILRETGALLVRDPRCSTEDNDRFIDMMEKYFEQPEEVKRVQERPHQHYQVIFNYVIRYTYVTILFVFYLNICR